MRIIKFMILTTTLLLGAPGRAACGRWLGAVTSVVRRVGTVTRSRAGVVPWVPARVFKERLKSAGVDLGPTPDPKMVITLEVQIPLDRVRARRQGALEPERAEAAWWNGWITAHRAELGSEAADLGATVPYLALVFEAGISRARRDRLTITPPAVGSVAQGFFRLRGPLERMSDYFADQPGTWIERIVRDDAADGRGACAGTSRYRDNSPSWALTSSKSFRRLSSASVGRRSTTTLNSSS